MEKNLDNKNKESYKVYLRFTRKGGLVRFL
jgi:hypothetical protein